MYNKANAKRTPNTPQSPNGVNFFSQFARSWIRPYGSADTKPPTAAKVLELKPFTCEWLLRPKVALSELAESLQKNLHHLVDDKTGLIEDDAKQHLHTSLAPLLQNLLPLGKASPGEATRELPTRENVVETLKFLFTDNEELDAQIDTLFSLGGTMFTMASQYIAARSFVRNPNTYANVVQATDGSDAAFQKAGDIKSMRNFIVDSVFPPRRCVSTSSGERRNLLSAFDDVEPSTSTHNTPVTQIHARDTELFDLPMATHRNTSTKVFSFKAKRPEYPNPPVHIESDEDGDEDENIPDDIPHHIPDDIPQHIPDDIPTKTKKRPRELVPIQDGSLEPSRNLGVVRV